MCIGLDHSHLQQPIRYTVMLFCHSIEFYTNLTYSTVQTQCFCLLLLLILISPLSS